MKNLRGEESPNNVVQFNFGNSTAVTEAKAQLNTIVNPKANSST